MYMEFQRHWKKNRHMQKAKWKYVHDEVLQCSEACCKQVSFYSGYNETHYSCLAAEDLI